MLYLLCSMLVMFMAIKSLFQLMAVSADPDLPSSQARAVGLSSLCAFVAVPLYTAPLIQTFNMAFAQQSGRPLPTEAHRWIVYCLLAGALLTAAHAYLAWKKSPADRRSSFWAIGRTVALVAAVIVGGTSAISHLMFFTSKSDGIASVGALKQMGLVKDMPDCPSDMALIKNPQKGEPVTYRCPTLLVFDSQGPQPFTPWPDYVQGQSQDLAAAIQHFTESAKQPAEAEKAE